MRCIDCRRYRVRGKGNIERDKDGNPIPTENPPPCSSTPCKSFEGKPRLSLEASAIIEKYATCRAFDALPRAGGINDQDPREMRVFRLLKQIDDEFQAESRNSIASKAGPMAGLLMSLPLLSGK